MPEDSTKKIQQKIRQSTVDQVHVVGENQQLNLQEAHERSRYSESQVTMGVSPTTHRKRTRQSRGLTLPARGRVRTMSCVKSKSTR